MTTVTLKLKNKTDWRFLKDLLNRLNISFEFVEEAKTESKPEKEEDDAIARLTGSWKSHLSSDEIIKEIYDARVNQTREIEL